MPSFIQPMQPTLAREPFSNPQWLFEPKWDGYRALCFRQKGPVKFISRNRRDLTSRFPGLQRVGKLITAEEVIWTVR